MICEIEQRVLPDDRRWRLGIHLLSIMNYWMGLLAGLCLVGTAWGEQEGNEKARRYHELLLKRPESRVMFERFQEAWLDTGSKEGLENYLRETATAGGALDWGLLARHLEFEGQDEESLEALGRAVDQAPQDARLRIQRARLQARLLDFEAALKDLDAAGEVANEGENAPLRGMYLVRLGQIEDAAAAWKALLEARPLDEELREDLIELAVGEGLFKEALGTMEGLLAITKDPYQRALRQLWKGEILVTAGKRVEALGILKTVFTSTGEGTWLEREVCGRIERIFGGEDDLVGLREFYERLNKEHPRRVELRKRLAWQVAASADTKRAIELFREVLRLTPGERIHREEFVDLLESAGALEDAVRELRVLLESVPSAEGWERMAGLEARRNNEPGVEGALEKILELPEKDVASVVRVARFYTIYGMPVKAEALLREANATDPASMEIGEALAGHLVGTDRVEEAVAIWRKMAKAGDKGDLLRVARSLHAHGLWKEEFALLEDRSKEFEGDVLLRSQYCEAAERAGELERGWKEVLHLVRGARTTTALDGALGLALELARGMDVEDLIPALEQGESVQELCLLAELYLKSGDDMLALEVLELASAKKEGELAAGRRVAMLARRGELGRAATVMRGLLDGPRGARPLQLRRLVELLVRAGSMEEALVEVDRWKQVSPGDRTAWMQRAEILEDLGRVDEAVVELRRAANKFDGDDGVIRGRLATMLIEAAEHREGERLYQKLFNESQSMSDKLRWLGELIKQARREERVPALIDEFERRRRSNPREVAPLRALAEIHRQLEDPVAQLEALREALRRKPNDLALMEVLAKIAEEGGDYEEAIRWRREAARRQPGPDASRRLAEFYLRIGETELGMAQLEGIDEKALQPRTVEQALLQLTWHDQWEGVLGYLAGLGELVESDWRMRYIRAVALGDVGRPEDAIDEFYQLLNEKDELKGVPELVQEDRFRLWASDNQEFLEAQWEYYSNVAIQHHELGERMELPGCLRELRWMVTKHLQDLVKGEEEQWKLFDRIRSLGLRDVFLGAMPEPGRLTYFQDRLAEDSENEILLAEAVQWVGADLDPELLERASSLGDPWRESAVRASFHLIWQGEKERAEKLLESLVLAERSDGHYLEEILEFVGGNLFSSHVLMLDEDGVIYDAGPIKKLKPEVFEAVLRTLDQVEDEGFWINNWEWIGDVMMEQFYEGRYRDGIALMNKACPIFDREIAKHGYNYLQHIDEWAKLPGFPSSPLFPQAASVLVEELQEEDEEEDESELTERQRILLKKLGHNVEGEVRALNKEELGRHLQEIEDPYLRMGLYAVCGMEEKVAAEMAVIVKEGELNALVLAAGLAVTEGREQEAYELLVRARARAKEQLVRRLIDGHLAAVGGHLAWDEDWKDKVDLDPARRAVMRLRRWESNKTSLARLMGRLGMEKERERFLNPPRTPTRKVGRRSVPPTRVNSPVTRLQAALKRNDEEAAIGEGVRSLRRILRGRRHNEEEVVVALRELKLRDKVLAAMAPGEERDLITCHLYVEACFLMEVPEKALALLRELVVAHPEREQFKSWLFRAQPLEEKSESIVKLAKEADLEALQEALTTMEDALATGDQVLAYTELLIEVLNTLEVDYGQERELGWILHSVLIAFGGWTGDGESLPTLETKLDLTAMDLVNEDAAEILKQRAEKKKWRRRIELAGQLGAALLRHPQTAGPGFQLVLGCREGLRRAEDSYIKEARQVVEQLLQWEYEGPWRDDTWERVTYNDDPFSTESEPPIGVSAVEYLVLKVGLAGEGLKEEWIEKLSLLEPEREQHFRMLSLLRADKEGEAVVLFREWWEAQPHKLDAGVGGVVELMEFLRELDRGGGILMKEIERLLGDRQFLHNLVVENVQEVGAYLVGVRLREGRERYFEMLTHCTEALMGDRERWVAYLELLEDGVLPDEVRGGESRIEALFEGLLSHEDAALETLVFVTRNRLQLIVEDARSAFRAGGRRQLAAETIAELEAKLGAAGLWSEDSYEVWGADLGNATPFISAVMGPLQIGERSIRDSRRQVGEAFMEAEGEGSFLKRLAGAYLIHDEESAKFVSNLLEHHSLQLRALPENQLKGLASLVRYWFTDRVIPNAGVETEKLLGLLFAEERKADLTKAKRLLAEGFAAQDNRGIAELVVKVAGAHREIAISLWRSYVNYLEEETKNGEIVPRYSQGLLLGPAENAEYSLLRALGESEVSVRIWLPLLVALEREDASVYSLTDKGGRLDSDFSLVMGGGDQFEGWEALGMALSELGTERYGGYVACYRVCGEGIKEPAKLLTWLEKGDFEERHAFLGRLCRLLAIATLQGGPGVSLEERVQAQAIAAELIADDRVVARMRMFLAGILVERWGAWLLDSPDGTSATVSLLEEFQNGKRQVVSPVVLRLLTSLLMLETGPKTEEFGRLVETYEEAFLGLDALRCYEGGEGKKPFLRVLTRMAFRSGKEESLASLEKRSGGTLRGDLGVLLAAGDTGRPEWVEKYLPAAGQLYSGRLARYNEVLQRRWAMLRELVPEERRYRLACMINGMPDSTEWKTGDGKTQEERLLELARNFDEQAPKVRAARLQTLGCLALSNAASEFLVEQMKAEARRFNMEEAQTTIELQAARLMFRQVVRILAEEAEISEMNTFGQKLMSLMEPLEGEQIGRALRQFRLELVLPILKGLVRHPEKVEGGLAFAQGFIESKLTVSDNGISEGALTLAVFAHALAGKGVEFDKRVADWDEDDRLLLKAMRMKGAMSYIGRLGSKGEPGHERWVSPEFEQERPVLLRAVLRDEATRQKLFREPSDLYSLIRNGTFTRKDLREALKEIPVDWPGWEFWGKSNLEAWAREAL